MRRRDRGEDEIDGTAREIRAHVSEVVVLWHNNLRFASESHLKSHLGRIGRTRGIKGDPLKKNARDLIEAAQFIVNRGVVLWTFQRRS